MHARVFAQAADLEDGVAAAAASVGVRALSLAAAGAVLQQPQHIAGSCDGDTGEPRRHRAQHRVLPQRKLGGVRHQQIVDDLHDCTVADQTNTRVSQQSMLLCT